MKRLLLVLLALAMVCVGVGATQITFQNVADYEYTKNTTCTRDYAPEASGDAVNNYLKCTCGPFCPTGFNTTYPEVTTYAAFTVPYGSYRPTVYFYRDTGALLGSVIATATTVAAPSRYEVSISGGVATLYVNGIVNSTSEALAVNPSYMRIYGDDGIRADDVVTSNSDPKYIVGMPEQGYVLKKDQTNPASSGLYSSAGVLISSTNMTSTWGKSDIIDTGNESLVLKNLDTGVIYGTNYTGSKSAGKMVWPVKDLIFDSGAPYGRYVTTIEGSGVVSDEIWYLGTGATISFDAATYNGEDTAVMTYVIDGAYWDTGTYDYSIDVISGTTGATMSTKAISASSGTSDYTFAATDPLGVYYGIVKATKRSDGTEVWMNYDYAELTSYVTVTGYVNDAESGLPISGANINITQSSIINNLTTIADGNYSATYYLSGAPITINSTAASYRQYEFTFTPLSAKTINVNISLVPDTPSTIGLGIGGVARDLTYGRPIKDATVNLINTTNAQSYSKTTSFTGWYLCDEGTSCFLTSARPYDVWGEKLGYSNSVNYTAVAA